MCQPTAKFIMKNHRKSQQVKIEDKQSIAIQNAARLLSEYGNAHRPAYDNPVTTVHLLVHALREIAV